MSRSRCLKQGTKRGSAKSDVSNVLFYLGIGKTLIVLERYIIYHASFFNLFGHWLDRISFGSTATDVNQVEPLN